MKTKVLSLIFSAVCLPLAHSQNLLAHWDMTDGASDNTSLDPESNSHPHVTPARMTFQAGSWYLDWSLSTFDSEDQSKFGANCFGGWNTGLEYVGFKITTDANAVGSIDHLNFDIANYGGASDPTQFKVTVLKNGTQVSQTGWNPITGLAIHNNGGAWTGTPDQNISYNNLSTTAGSSDMFEFRIMAGGGTERISLDNVRIFGDITHIAIPEPSTTLLGALVLVGAAFQRRR